MSQIKLIEDKSFHGFFFAQFLGAFNDNVFKNGIVMLITFKILADNPEAARSLVVVSAGVFILPFFLFAATTGQIADRYQKATIIRYVKAAEILVMALGAVAFYLEDPYFLMVVLFLMGTQSTFLGPLKYAIVPQLVKTEEDITSGNALVLSSTFVAIIIGSIVGGFLVEVPYSTLALGGAVLFFAYLGYQSSLRIENVPVGDPSLKVNWNFIATTFRLIAQTRREKYVFHAILGVAHFWLIGSIFLQLIPNYAQVQLGIEETYIPTLMIAMFSIGIALGSIFCDNMSEGRIETGLVPIGGFGITIAALDLYFAGNNIPRIFIDLVLIGTFGGIYSIPLMGFIQTHSPKDSLARCIACGNIMNAFLIVVASLLTMVLAKNHFTSTEIFFLAGLYNFVIAGYVFYLLPELIIRLMGWVILHTIYRLKIRGMEKIPNRGPVVLVCNHVSFIDFLVIFVASKRPVRFVMDYNIYRTPVLNWLLRWGKVIPIASKKESPEVLEKAFSQIAEVLESGEVLCIFPEGMITHDGELNIFRPGIEKIIQRTPVPVVPMSLTGLWGSFFSRKDGAFQGKWKLRANISINIAEMIPPEKVSANLLEEKVKEMHELEKAEANNENSV